MPLVPHREEPSPEATRSPGKAKVVVDGALLAHVFPWVFGYGLVSLVSKVQASYSLGGGLDLALSLQAWAPDVFWLGLVTLVFGALVSRRSALVRGSAALGLGTVTGAFMVLELASNAYFEKTGTPLSWSTIDYWLSNMRETNRILESQGQTWKFGLLAGLAAVSVLLQGFVLTTTVRRKWLNHPRACGRRCALGVAAVLLITLGSGWVPSAAGRSGMICHNVPTHVVSDWARARWFPEGPFEVTATERVGQRAELEASPSTSRRNVVIILFESLSWKQCDVYGGKQGVTPFLEELASQSLVIQHEYTVVPHTTKAVAATLCGFYPYLETSPGEARPGLLPPRCLAHLLREQGYATGFFQPAGNFEEREKLVSSLGFQVYKGLDDLPQEGFSPTNYFGREENMMLGPALDWVDGVKDQPFLLTLLTLSTHHDYKVPAGFPTKAFETGDEELENYLNSARYTDEFIRQVVEGFRSRGLLENTIFVLLGDHGEAFGEHGRRQHDLVLWEEGIRALGMIYAPALFPEGRLISGYRSHLDLVPSVLDFLGLETKDGDFLGSSWLKPVPEDRRQYLSCWYNQRCLALREGPVKLIYHYDLLPVEIYDNSHDPLDQHNLAYSGPYDADFIGRRVAELKRWHGAVNQQYSEWEQALRTRAMTAKPPEVGLAVGAVWEDRVELVGATIKPAQVSPGGELEVQLVFKAAKPLDGGERLFVEVKHPSGSFRADHIPAGGTLPEQHWKPGQFVEDRFRIHVPGLWPSGALEVTVGFWDEDSRGRLRLTAGSTADGQTVALPAVHVESRPPVLPGKVGHGSAHQERIQ